MASRKVKTAEDEAEKLKKEEEERQLVNLFQMLNVPSTIIYNSKPVLKGHSDEGNPHIMGQLLKTLFALPHFYKFAIKEQYFLIYNTNI